MPAKPPAPAKTRRKSLTVSPAEKPSEKTSGTSSSAVVVPQSDPSVAFQSGAGLAASAGARPSGNGIPEVAAPPPE